MFFPFQDPNRFRNQLDVFFGEDFWKKFEPYFEAANAQLNVYENDETIILLISMPGIEHFDDVKVEIDGTRLKIAGEITLQFQDFELKEEGLFNGKFERNIVIPSPVYEKHFKKTYENGLIKIVLKKRPAEKAEPTVYKTENTDTHMR